MMQELIPIVIRKDGSMAIIKFPVELNGGDRLVIVREVHGVKIPKGEKWVVRGYDSFGLNAGRIMSGRADG